jgi:hypothetical protein
MNISSFENEDGTRLMFSQQLQLRLGRLEPLIFSLVANPCRKRAAARTGARTLMVVYALMDASYCQNCGGLGKLRALLTKTM